MQRLRATIAAMSASDAAPLPRLGEVFFDVRGDSRSMRLSWYADTGVAVFSIWQGGRCTGTFRLPIDDLPRMIEILRDGPPGLSRAAGGADAGHPAAARYEDQPPAGNGWADADGGDDAFFEEESAGYPGESYSTDAYQAESYRDDRYGDDRYGEDRGVQGYRDDGYGTGDYGHDRYQDAYPADRTAWPGPGTAPPDAADGSGRFVPPYVRQPGPSYRNDSASGQPGYPAGFGGPAYPSDHHADSPAASRYRQADGPEADYEDDEDYRLSPRRRRSGH